MGFFDILKKKEIKIEHPVTEEKKILQADVSISPQLSLTAEDVSNNKDSSWSIVVCLALDKNDPHYNALIEKLIDTYLPLWWENKTNSRVILSCTGLMYFCKQIAKENGINMELTNWNVEHIVISSGEKIDGYNSYINSNTKTLADCARERAFAR